MKNGNGKRPAPISYRPPVSLEDEFNSRVQKSGLSISAYITQCVFGAPPPRQSKRPPASQKLLAKLLGEATKIHGDLQALSHSTDMNTENQALYERACTDLTEIRAAILKNMGRQP